MYKSELTDAFDQSVSGIKTNIETLRSISGSLESIRVSIESEGMSRDLAELMEQTVPGSITKHTRINGFTQYPSNVGKKVALESLFTTRSFTASAMIGAAVAAVAALFVKLIKWLTDQFTGKAADERRQRANSREYNKHSSPLGSAVPGWDDDPQYRAANITLQETVTQLLVATATGRNDILLRGLVSGGARSLVETLATQVTNDLSAVRAIGERVLGSLAVSDAVAGNDRVLEELHRFVIELQGGLDLTENISIPGLAGAPKAPLSERLMETREHYEQMSDTLAFPIKENSTMEDMDSIRETISEAARRVEALRYDALRQRLATLAKELRSATTRTSERLGTGAKQATEYMADAISIIHIRMNMIADIVAIVTLVVTSVNRADEASVRQLKIALDALSAAGAKFNSNDSRWRAEREFYLKVQKYTS